MTNAWPAPSVVGEIRADYGSGRQGKPRPSGVLGCGVSASAPGNTQAGGAVSIGEAGACTGSRNRGPVGARDSKAQPNWAFFIGCTLRYMVPALAAGEERVGDHLGGRLVGRVAAQPRGVHLVALGR